MHVRYIFNTSGNYVAFAQGGHLFDPNGEWLGFIEDGDDVYSARDGSYMGTISADDRLLVNIQVHGHNRLRPMRPIRPMRPMRPMRRLRMSRLPQGFRDYFEVEIPRPASKLLDSIAALINSGHVPPEAAAELLTNIGNRAFPETLEKETLLGSQLKTPSGIFLGNVNRNRFDTDSLVNPYGSYGSRYSSESIFNKYSQFGSPYGSESPYNRFSSAPPMFVKDGHTLGYLTVNQYLSPRIDPDEFINWLGTG